MRFNWNKLGNTLIWIMQVKLSGLHVSSGFYHFNAGAAAENLWLSGDGIGHDLAGKDVVRDEGLRQ